MKNKKFVFVNVILIITIMIEAIAFSALVYKTENEKMYQCGTLLCFELKATPFTNPNDNLTENLGGWKIMFKNFNFGDGGGEWLGSTITIEFEGSIIFKWTRLSSIQNTTSDLSKINVSGENDPRWFLKKGTNVNISDIRFVDGSPQKIYRLNESQDLLDQDNYQTLEGTRILIVDNYKQGEITKSDIIYVYKDSNGDSIVDLFSNSKLKISASGTTITSVSLK